MLFSFPTAKYAVILTGMLAFLTGCECCGEDCEVPEPSIISCSSDGDCSANDQICVFAVDAPANALGKCVADACQNAASNPCAAEAVCAVNPLGGAIQCICPEGKESSDGTNCVDIDECARSLDKCSENADCQNRTIEEDPQGFVCKCKAGFEGDDGFERNGVRCEDINDCATNPCEENEECVNQPGRERDCVPCDEEANEVLQGDACEECEDGLTAQNGECVDITNNCGENTCIGGQKCVDGVDRFTCEDCNQGEDDCIDINECNTDANTCDANSTTCENDLNAGFRCECKNGFEDDPNSEISCTEINECAINNGGCAPQRECLDRVGTAVCGNCALGFTPSGDFACVDTNECLANTDDCGLGATCRNIENGNGFICTCPEGFELDPITKDCKDIDECARNLDDCDNLRSCIDLNGSFTCGDCPTGFRNLGNNQCQDIDECNENTDNCQGDETCVNQTGSFRCDAVVCPAGQIANQQGQCVDDNECLASTSPCDLTTTTCTNLINTGFRCECLGGFEDDPQSDRSCRNINECLVNNGGCDARSVCTDNVGSRVCGDCPAGFATSRDANGNTTCTDINECLTNNGGCGSGFTCVNNTGSFTCNDINECLTNNGGCDARTACTNNEGFRTCGDCPAGFTTTRNTDGSTVCTDINECALNTDGCGLQQICVNNAGSFACQACPSGQVGDNDQCVNNFPVQLFADGGDTNCVIMKDSTVRCWGNNDRGQIGDGTTLNRAIPVTVNGFANAIRIAVGGRHNCAIFANGNVRCVGANSSRQLGIVGGDQSTPIDVPLGNTKSIATSSLFDDTDAHTCAILNDNSVRCWGSNGLGQIGDGTTSAIRGITDINLLGIQEIHTSIEYTCALTTTGTLKCWGRNQVGSLGNGENIDVCCTAKTRPVDVLNINNATSFEIGSFFGCAVLSDKTIKCWGDNTSGQLGINSSTAFFSTPAAIPNLSGVAGIAAGDQSVCAVVSSGNIKCWGRNTRGQLGDGSTTNRLSPVDVVGISNATQVAVGFQHACALLQDRSVKCWGANNVGQLGNNTNTDSRTPVTVLFQ